MNAMREARARTRCNTRKMNENAIAKQVVDAAYKVHVTLGPGLLESAYEAALAHEIQKRGLRVDRQVSIPLVYDAVELGEGFRADLIVEDLVIVEVKSVEQVAPVTFRQLLTYLKLTNKHLGLVINFNVARIKDGIRRLARDLNDKPTLSDAEDGN